jgi:MFS family permease
LLAGVLLLGGFVVHAVRGNGEPTIDVHLFRVRSFAASASALFMTGLSLYGVALLLPLFYQQVRGQTALVAGLLLAPQGIGSLLARGSAGRLSDRFGPRPVVLVGVFLALIGALPYSWAGVGTSEVLLGACLIMRGAGLSAVNVAVMVAAYRGLRAEQVPHASSATRILLQVGGSFGVAVTAVNLQQEVGSHAAADADAFGDAFRWLLGLTAVAAVPALGLPGRQAGTLDSKEMSSTSGQPAGR